MRMRVVVSFLFFLSIFCSLLLNQLKIEEIGGKSFEHSLQ